MSASLFVPGRDEPHLSATLFVQQSFTGPCCVPGTTLDTEFGCDQGSSSSPEPGARGKEKGPQRGALLRQACRRPETTGQGLESMRGRDCSRFLTILLFYSDSTFGFPWVLVKFLLKILA